MGMSETLKAISDPARREILEMLKEGKKTAGEIASRFDLTGATVSYHLSTLKKAGLIAETKYKKYIFYELNISVFEEVLIWIKGLGVILMKKINMKSLIITSTVCLLPIICGLIFYNSLPESIAIHWGIDNNPNGYFSKPAFVFGMPIIMVALQVFCCIVSDWSDKNPEANKKAITVYKWIIPIITVVMYIVTIAIALGNDLDIRKIVMCVLGILFIISGNYMPKVRSDYYMNSKVFWVKNRDEKLVNKAMKVTAYGLIGFGILFILSILFDVAVSIAVSIATIVFCIFIYLYVYIKSRK